LTDDACWKLQLIGGILLIVVLGSLTYATSVESRIDNTDIELKTFYNGTIYAGGSTITDSLLVHHGVVQALGTNPADTPDATRIDLNGTFVYPGFHDSHVHLVEAGYGFSSGCFLYGATDADAICKLSNPLLRNFLLLQS
jgi:hypothetical protein